MLVKFKRPAKIALLFNFPSSFWYVLRLVFVNHFYCIKQTYFRVFENETQWAFVS
jgi:hypothetical protein